MADDTTRYRCGIAFFFLVVLFFFFLLLLLVESSILLIASSSVVVTRPNSFCRCRNDLYIVTVTRSFLNSAIRAALLIQSGRNSIANAEDDDDDADGDGDNDDVRYCCCCCVIGCIVLEYLPTSALLLG